MLIESKISMFRDLDLENEVKKLPTETCLTRKFFNASTELNKEEPLFVILKMEIQQTKASMRK